MDLTTCSRRSRATVEELSSVARLASPRRAVLLLHRRDHVADPRGLHVVRGRRGEAQEHHVDGDEEHPHHRRRHAVVLLLRLVHLRLLRARRARAGTLRARPSSRASAARRRRGRTRWARTSRTTSARVFFLAFLLFSWTTASIMSGALIERVRLSAYLLLAVLLGSAVWIMDAAWGWSPGGWLDDEVRLPRLDRLARRARRRRCVHARRPAQPRPADREVRHEGQGAGLQSRTTRT